MESTKSYVRLNILLSREKGLHDRTISLKGEIWVIYLVYPFSIFKLFLTSPRFIKVPVSRQGNVRGSYCASFYHFTIGSLNWLNEFRSLDLTTHTSLSPIRRGFAPSFVNYKKGALDSQPQVIKFISCLPMVGGSLRVLRLLPPLKLVAMI